MLVALASLVFAGSNGLPELPSPQPQQRETRPSISDNTPKKRDYVEMKSDEGWQTEHNGKKIMIVVGNFAAHHNGTVITADSAVRYSERHIECFGNVLINRGTTYIYGDRAEYDGNINEARVYSNIVKVVDGDATLYTYNFLFNTQTNIGRYSGGGVLISGDNMLESERGYLYSDTHEIICVDKVQMRNDEYEMTGDSVVYNTETNFAQFFTNTNIWNKGDGQQEGDYLYADRGTFDKEKQLYTLTLNGYILTAEQELLCDSLDYYRDSNYVLLRRNIQIDDSSQKMLIFGHWGEYWKEPGNVFVTKNPSLISYDTTQSDSVFMSSDSMFVYTRYPIREKIEQARRDSLEQAAKAAAADSLKGAKKGDAKGATGDAKGAQATDTKSAKRGDAKGAKGDSKGAEMAQKGKMQERGESSVPAEMQKGGKSDGRADGRQRGHRESASDAAERLRNRVAAQGERDGGEPSGAAGVANRPQQSGVADTVRMVADSVAKDSVKVAKDSVAVTPKTKAELRREMIDSLESDSTKRGFLLRAKLLKQEAVELNKVVKAWVKEVQRKKAEERAKVLAERQKLYVKVLGEAKVRDAERRRIERAIEKRINDSLKVVKDSVKRAEKIVNDSLKRVAKIAKRKAILEAKLAKKQAKRVAKDSLLLDSLRRDSLKFDSLKIDTLKIDSLAKSLQKVDSLKIDSVKINLLKADSIKQDSLKQDSLKQNSVKLDSLKTDSLKRDSLKVDSLKRDSLKVDSLAQDSTKQDSLAKFDTMTVKQVKAHFKAIYDAEKAEEERIKQDSLNAKLDRIGLARQAKRTEQYKKWARRDSIYAAKEQERADERLRRKLARLEKRGIYIEMADSAELRIVDSILSAEFEPLDTLVNHQLDSMLDILFPKPVVSPTEIMKKDSMNIDSLYREIRAYSRVKMFRSDAQSICDSLTMTTIDSIIHMYKSPVLWNGVNQITSEIMHIITRNSELVQANFEGKPMMIAEIDTTHYNQVTGKEMTALFRDKQIYRNDVNSNVQTIYYMQEDNSPEITLMAYIEAGDMTSYIEGQQVTGITYRGNPVYTFYPMDKIPETQPKKLEGFKWEIARRPLQDSVFTRTIRPSQRTEKRALRKPTFPINALMQQIKADYIRRKEWQERTDTLSYETIEWLESLKSF